MEPGSIKPKGVERPSSIGDTRFAISPPRLWTGGPREAENTSPPAKRVP